LLEITIRKNLQAFSLAEAIMSAIILELLLNKNLLISILFLSLGLEFRFKGIFVSGAMKL